MNKNPIPKRASLSLQAVEEPKVTRQLAQPKSNGCFTPWLLGFCIVLLVYLIWNMLIVPTYTNLTNSFAYGKARISETTADVGHGGESTFIGLVENGQIVVIELAGNPPKPMVYVVGQTEAASKLVTVTFQDVAGRGRRASKACRYKEGICLTISFPSSSRWWS